MRAIVVAISLVSVGLLPAAGQIHRNPARNAQVEPVNPGSETDNSWPDVHVKIVLLNDSLKSNGKLNISAFQLFENGVAQQIRTVSGMDSPISVGLLIDGSGSTLPDRARFEDAAMDIIKGLPDGSEVMAAWFAGKANIDLRFVPASEVDFSSIERSTMTGGTAILDALIDTEIYIAANAHNERRALVLLSDGGENSSKHGVQDAMRLFQSPDAPQLFTFDIADPNDAYRDREALIMTSLAEGGGGIAVLPERDRDTPAPESTEKTVATVRRKARDTAPAPFADLDIEAAAAKLSALLRRQYVLTYTTTDPKRDGTLRKLEVKLPEQLSNFKIYTLAGYYAQLEKRAPH